MGNGAVAEELAQDVFFRLWLCRARLDEQRGSLRDLSFTMARNCALDYIRSSHHYRTAQSVTFELAESLRLIAQTGTELTYMRRGRLRSVLGKATALPKQQQKALMLAYGYGYSHTEIAVIMKTPLGTVKSWLRNALRSLREE